MSETAILQSIRAAVSSGPNRVFRNNVGMAVAADGRRIQYGLAKGSSDLIGWRTIKITPEMIGLDLAQFVSLEVKSPRGKVRPEQINWLRAVNDAGGIAAIVRSAEEAREILSQ
jgi:hypothetical protein